MLRLELKSHEREVVKVKGITVAFPGSPQPAFEMQGVNMDGGDRRHKTCAPRSPRSRRVSQLISARRQEVLG